MGRCRLFEAPVGPRTVPALPTGRWRGREEAAEDVGRQDVNKEVFPKKNHLKKNHLLPQKSQAWGSRPCWLLGRRSEQRA